MIPAEKVLMGYFKRKIDRAGSRDRIRGLHVHAPEREGWSPWEGEPWIELYRLRYVCFSIPERDDQPALLMNNAG